jgi:amino acid transporter
MGRYGIFPISIGSSHKMNLTPHVAITSFAALQFLIPSIFMLLSYAGAWNVLQIGAPFDEFNDAGLFGAMGFCGAYVLISLATPFYLKKIGELKIYHIVICVLALLLLIVPIVGTVYPAPAYPLNYFAYIFGAYLAAGIVVVMIRSRSKSEIESIRKMLEEKASAAGSTPPTSPSMPDGASPAVA